MRKVFAVVLAVMVLIPTIVGCTNETASTTAETELSTVPETFAAILQTEPTEDENFEATMMTKEPEEWETEPPDDPNEGTEFGSTTEEEENLLLIPWKVNAAQQAKQDGKVHYWFMSSEGQKMIAGATYPEKWGDACLIALPDGTLILMDTGHKPYAPTLVQNLRRLGVQKLDYILISHYHPDHTGGLTEPGGVLDSFSVGQVYGPNVQSTIRAQVESACAKKNIPMKKLLQGEKLNLGQMTMQVLWPDLTTAGTKLETTEQNNNGSMVVRLDYNGHSALFTGDIYTAVEGTIAGKYADLLNVDLLKLPHHGDTTSNSSEFAVATTPKIAVATGYLDVSTNVYTTYQSLGAKVLADSFDGYVHITADGASLTWESSRQR